ncbi:hypothetical protein JWZ98_03310 [Methylomonas sp. EFPC1]|uniref:hypothetical protein n=1 Tax=Methylomonas sp. EFPC1 TaxID=2812647 RepID=UPI0019675790|nr:hypothetical protein [Methylomonas sp. EFPC1]QSB02004.1 hypothetical protein JWZ98_03310 [Methylomonas sp. EFPC1]
MNTAATQYLRRIYKARPDYGYRQSASDLAWTLCDLMNKQMAQCLAELGSPGFSPAEVKLKKLIRVHGKSVKRSIKVTDKYFEFQAHQLRWYPA